MNIPTISIKQNIHRLKAEIKQACHKSGRSSKDIKLIWVSKNRPLSTILEATHLGATYLGENKVQEVLNKFPLPIQQPPELHFIGHLQSNKTRKILPLIQAIHSVDSPKLFNSIVRISEDLQTHIQIFFQINISGEGNKHGFTPELFLAWAQNLPKNPWIHYEGLMTMAPHTDNLNLVRTTFKHLRELSYELQTFSGPAQNLRKLSMGMSRDFKIAIEEGSHYIRIGTELFGPRILSNTSIF